MRQQKAYSESNLLELRSLTTSKIIPNMEKVQAAANFLRFDLRIAWNKITQLISLAPHSSILALHIQPSFDPDTHHHHLPYI